MKIKVSNAELPGITSEVTVVLGTERARYDVFADAEYIGQVVYIARRRKASFVTDYGWRPAQAPAQSKLTSKVEAIRRLPRMVSA